MITKFKIKWFKSFVNLEIEPGIVNVLIGANGSGKSNFLEAIGVLSSAAFGHVDDESLLRRGVRPGVPALYKCALSNVRTSPNITFGAWSGNSSYMVSLYNPIEKPAKSWDYHTEILIGNKKIGRSHRKKEFSQLNPERGLAALKSLELNNGDPALDLLKNLQEYVIYTPNTNTLRGTNPDPQQREPIGLSGGQLANSLLGIFIEDKESFAKSVIHDTLSLIDWAHFYAPFPVTHVPLSPSVPSTKYVIRFADKYMKSKRSFLTGYDVSEGALYVIFHAVLAAHPASPPVCAVDNADHGLNPRLAQNLFRNICKWYLQSPHHRQIFLTTQNPLVLDGLDLKNDNIRLFTVSRTEKGRTTINRVVFDENLKKMAANGWTLSRLWVMGHLGGIPNV